jgi:hypothetical protein
MGVFGENEGFFALPRPCAGKKINFLGGHGRVRTNPPSRRAEIGVGVGLFGRMYEPLTPAIA